MIGSLGLGVLQSTGAHYGNRRPDMFIKAPAMEAELNVEYSLVITIFFHFMIMLKNHCMEMDLNLYLTMKLELVHPQDLSAKLLSHRIC